MVLAIWLSKLIAGVSGSALEPMDQAEPLELLEGAVNARSARGGVLGSKLILDLQRRNSAALLSQAFDHRKARTALPISGLRESPKSVSDPIVMANLGHCFDPSPRPRRALAMREPRNPSLGVA